MGIMSEQPCSEKVTIIVIHNAIPFLDIEKTFNIKWLDIWHLSTFLAEFFHGVMLPDVRKRTFSLTEGSPLC